VWPSRPSASDEDSTRIDLLHEQWRPIIENIEQFTAMGGDIPYKVEAIDRQAAVGQAHVHPVSGRAATYLRSAPGHPLTGSIA
jgi:hypothetical protein